MLGGDLSLAPPVGEGRGYLADGWELHQLQFGIQCLLERLLLLEPHESLHFLVFLDTHDWESRGLSLGLLSYDGLLTIESQLVSAVREPEATTYQNPQALNRQDFLLFDDLLKQLVPLEDVKLYRVPAIVDHKVSFALDWHLGDRHHVGIVSGGVAGCVAE